MAPHFSISGKYPAIILVTLALMLLLPACARSENTDTTPDASEPADIVETTGDSRPRHDPGELAGTEWVLTSLRGREPIGGNYGTVTLDFDKDALRGSAGCNAYGGDVEIKDGSIRTFGFDMTEVGCGGAMGRQENEYLNALENGASYRMTDDRLEIRNKAGDTILIFSQRARYRSDPADLAGTEWMVHTVNGEPLDDGATIPTLSFDTEKEFSGYDGCQHYRGEYFATASDVSFPNIGMVEDDCMKPDATPAEMGIPGGYPPGEDYRLGEGRLEIFSPDETVVYVPLRDGVNTGRTGSAWRLQKFIERGEITPMLPGTKITLTFDRGTLRRTGKLGGSAGCNTYDASYDYPTEDNTLERIEVANPSTTRQTCPSPAGVMEQERRYLEVLADLGEYPTNHGSRMRLETKDGRALVFSAPG